MDGEAEAIEAIHAALASAQPDSRPPMIQRSVARNRLCFLGGCRRRTPRNCVGRSRPPPIGADLVVAEHPADRWHAAVGMVRDACEKKRCDARVKDYAAVLRSLHAVVMRKTTVRRGTARHGTARHGTAQHRAARHGTAAPPHRTAPHRMHACTHARAHVCTNAGGGGGGE